MGRLEQDQRHIDPEPPGLAAVISGVRTATSRLCWGHRDIILTRFGGHASCSGESALAVGAGRAAAGYRESDTVLLAGVCGPAPADAAFTWSTAAKLLHIR